jgi:hypothetical protein
MKMRRMFVFFETDENYRDELVLNLTKIESVSHHGGRSIVKMESGEEIIIEGWRSDMLLQRLGRE